MEKQASRKKTIVNFEYVDLSIGAVDISQQKVLVIDYWCTLLHYYTGCFVLRVFYIFQVLLEILLRCCPGIKTVYILLREKKGVRPEDRKEKLFERTVRNYGFSLLINANFLKATVFCRSLIIYK